ncbi:MAG: T9SS type A sorting domain-containing protein [candidate division WOR-3 bacterium]
MKRVLLFLVLLMTIGVSQELAWKRWISFPGIAGGDYLDLAVDSKDNVIVTAMDTGLGSWLIKYNPDGEILWTKEVHLPVDRSRVPWTIQVATDPDDNIIVGRDSAQSKWTVKKLSSTGEWLWTWDTLFYPEVYLTDIATNSNGYILITGFRYGTYESMWFTFQITPEGVTKWMRTFTSEWGPDKGLALCVDPWDNVIVSGCRGIQWYNRQWYPAFIKYSPTGKTLAEDVYIFPYSGNFSGSKPATDRWGNIYFPGCGFAAKSGGGHYWYGSFLFKYDPDGTPLWRWFSDTASDGFITIYQCATDSFGNIYLSARMLPFDSYSPNVIYLYRFSSSGNTVIQFLNLLSERNQRWEFATPVWLETDRHGDVIVATKVGTGNPVNDTGYVLKFTNWPVGIKEPKHPGHCERSEAISSLPTVIHRGKPIALNLPPETNIEVYDKTGRLLNKEKGGEAGQLSLSTGVYFLRILSDNHQERRRIIVVK